MYGHWFVLGSQFNTKIFTQAEDKLTLRVVKVLNNPLGRERSRNLHGKKPGSMMTSGGGAFRNTESSGLTPHEQEAVQFARVINHYLQSCQEQRQFETLTIVAEPHFLGKLKSAMSPRLLNAVVSWIEKDYMNISYEELPSIIKKNENRVYPIHR